MSDSKTTNSQHSQSQKSQPITSVSQGLPLVERLDDALGEASSGIGAMLTELVRKSLRGGVQKIGDEIETLANDILDQSVEARLPEFRDVAIEGLKRKHGRSPTRLPTV